MKPTDQQSPLSRRHFLAAAGAVSVVAATALEVKGAETPTEKPVKKADPIVTPPEGKRILLACKLGMITRKLGGKSLSFADRLSLAGEAGFDGVDLNGVAGITPEGARDAVVRSGVFVHNSVVHDHWRTRLTSENADKRAEARANVEHGIRVSHGAGGSGVLLVIGKGSDGPENVITARCREEIKKLLPLAAALGQPILIENVWNQMLYDHDAPPEQTPEKFINFIDSFNSPWVGMYYDIGNHWKYGQPGEWIRQLGRRCVKLDVKGFSRAKNKFTDIGEGDLPWEQVRKALDDIGFTGWATAEVKGGDLKRLTTVRKQMQKAFGLS